MIELTALQDTCQSNTMQTVLPGQSYTALASRSASLLRVVLGTLTARLSWLTCSGSRYFRDKTNQAHHSFSPFALSLSLSLWLFRDKTNQALHSFSPLSLSLFSFARAMAKSSLSVFLSLAFSETKQTKHTIHHSFSLLSLSLSFPPFAPSSRKSSSHYSKTVFHFKLFALAVHSEHGMLARRQRLLGRCQRQFGVAPWLP